jgi:hypothetical protein
LPIAVGGGRAWLVLCWSPASVDLVGAMPLLIKHPLEGPHRSVEAGLSGRMLL